MSSKNEAVSYSVSCSNDQAAEHLQTLAQCIRKGDTQIKVGEQSIVLNFSQKVDLEIDAKVKSDKGKGKLKIEISYKTALPSDDVSQEILSLEICPAPSEQSIATQS